MKIEVAELEEGISSQKNEYGCVLLLVLVGGRWEKSREHGDLRTATAATAIGASTGQA